MPLDNPLPILLSHLRICTSFCCNLACAHVPRDYRDQCKGRLEPSQLSVAEIADFTDLLVDRCSLRKVSLMGNESTFQDRGSTLHSSNGPSDNESGTIEHRASAKPIRDVVPIFDVPQKLIFECGLDDAPPPGQAGRLRVRTQADVSIGQSRHVVLARMIAKRTTLVRCPFPTRIGSCRRSILTPSGSLAACASRRRGAANALPEVGHPDQRAGHDVRPRVLRPGWCSEMSTGRSCYHILQRNRHAAPPAQFCLRRFSRWVRQFLRSCRNLIFYPYAHVYVDVEEETDSNRAPPHCLWNEELYNTDLSHGFVSGYATQFGRVAGPVFEAMMSEAKSILPWAADHHRMLRKFNGRPLALSAICDGLPQSRRARSDPERQLRHTAAGRLHDQREIQQDNGAQDYARQRNPGRSGTRRERHLPHQPNPLWRLAPARPRGWVPIQGSATIARNRHGDESGKRRVQGFTGRRSAHSDEHAGSAWPRQRAHPRSARLHRAPCRPAAGRRSMRKCAR